MNKWLQAEKDYWNSDIKMKQWMPLCLQSGAICLSMGSLVLFYWLISGVYSYNEFSWIVVCGKIGLSLLLLIGIVCVGIYSWHYVKLNLKESK